MTRIATFHRRRTRPGFTIVELLVAAAVCVLIMAILATCFQTGIDAVRQLKSQGDMTDQLRAAEIVIRRDLQAKRFLTEDDKENLGVRLSDLRYDQLMMGGATLTTASGFTFNIDPPRGGFMRIKSVDPFDPNVNPADINANAATNPNLYGTVYEGSDQDQLMVGRAINHYLHFTSILSGGIDQNVYSALVNTLNGQVTATSPAAEIALFLDTGGGPVNFAGTVPLYNLIRRQRLVALTDSDRYNFIPPSPSPLDTGVISVSLMTGTVNTMADLTNPNNRLCGFGRNPANWNQMSGAAPNGGVVTTTPLARNTAPGYDAFLAPLGTPSVPNAPDRTGDDVLLSNVISFEVKVNWEPAKYGMPALGVPPISPGPRPAWIAPRAFRGAFPPFNDNDNDGIRDDDFPFSPPGNPLGLGNTDYPFDYLPGRVNPNNLTGGFNDHMNRSINSLNNQVANGRYVFDTWTKYPVDPAVGWTTFAGWNSAAIPANSDAIPMRIRVKSIQIRIRVFDPKLKNARQMTIVQDL